MGFAMGGQGIECTLDLLFVSDAALGPGFELSEEPVSEFVIGKQAVEIATGNQPIARDRALVPPLDPQHGEMSARAGRFTDMHLVAGHRQASAYIRAAGGPERFVTLQARDHIQ